MLVHRDAVIFNVSEIELALTCRRKWYNEYILCNGVQPSIAMQEGTRYHRYAEMALKCEPAPAALALEPLWMRGALEGLKDWLMEWTPTVIDTESPMTYETSALMPDGKRVVFIGRLDALVRGANGRIFHLQHKTCRAGLSIRHFVDLQSVSWHEALYGRMLARSYGLEYAGTLMAIARKRSTAPFFEAHPIHIRRAEQAVNGLVDYAVELYGNIMLNRRDPDMNRTACLGVWQNSRCPFFDLCYSAHPLMMPHRTPYDSYPTDFIEGLAATYGPRVLEEVM